MPKKCNRPDCEYPQFGGGYCKNHQWMRGDKKRSLPKRTPIKASQKRIPNFSKKRTEINVQYSAEAAKFRADHPFCRVNSPDCVRETQGVHHLKGKATIALLMDKRHWKPSCNPCNSYVEKHPDWAYKTGNKLLHNGKARKQG